MMGGRRIRKNIVGEKASTLLVSASGKTVISRPRTAPRKTMARLSGR